MFRGLLRVPVNWLLANQHLFGPLTIIIVQDTLGRDGSKLTESFSTKGLPTYCNYFEVILALFWPPRLVGVLERSRFRELVVTEMDKIRFKGPHYQSAGFTSA